ncbi:hypothetical protein HanXRQr2_Chr09g0388921 [Helianthus annuus]|uniref:Uncharacterized protein n=1 Tax=Helianthus annuus TaxID=4232 RepID=A0A9K3I626_HELAN|nr:hypothetical protein HanXRQr2_Chr09g0388921 [Helianthus annuus]
MILRSTGKGCAKWKLPLLEDPGQLAGSKPPYRVTDLQWCCLCFRARIWLGIELMPGQEPPKSKPSHLPLGHWNKGSLFIFLINFF